MSFTGLCTLFITFNNTNVGISGQVKKGSSHVYDQFDVTSRHRARLVLFTYVFVFINKTN